VASNGPVIPSFDPIGSTGMPQTPINKAIEDGKTSAIYIGRAAAAWTSISLTFKVNTAITTSGGNPVWAEAAIMRGTPVPNSGVSLTTLGFTDISTTGKTLGVKTVAVAVTGVAEGDHLWAAIGWDGLTGTFQLDGAIPDRFDTGKHQLAAVRPSTMGAPEAFLREGTANNTLLLTVSPS
jgi:hypothetical protein